MKWFGCIAPGIHTAINITLIIFLGISLFGYASIRFSVKHNIKLQDSVKMLANHKNGVISRIISDVASMTFTIYYHRYEYAIALAILAALNLFVVDVVTRKRNDKITYE